MIPNIFHFCYGLAEDFGGKPFSLVHFLAVKSALEVNRPDEIFFYYKYEPKGEWWDKTKKIVTMVKVIPPDMIFGNELVHVAHKADILRLNILIEKGGIYLDLDTINDAPIISRFLILIYWILTILLVGSGRIIIRGFQRNLLHHY